MRGSASDAGIGELRRAVERCGELDLVLRDVRSGSGIPLGPAGDPERPIPGDVPGSRLECADGFLVMLEEPPTGGLAPSAVLAGVRRIAGEQRAAAAAIKRAVPSARIAGRFQRAINALHVRMPARGVGTLRSLGLDVRVNGEVRADLADTVPLIGANQVWQNTAPGTVFNVRGRGVEIAILDTGVDYDHPDLGNGCYGIPPDPILGISPCKVVGGYDIVNQDDDPMDDHGHGTHVAGIAAADGEVEGVAPEALIYAYKVLNAGGWGTVDQVIEGIERAIDRDGDPKTDDGADIINLSLSTIGSPTSPLSMAADTASASGAVVVAAAGNGTKQAGDERTIRSPGTSLSAITVGSTGKADFSSDFSSRGPVVWDDVAVMKPDLVAPGEDVCAPRHGAFAGVGECLNGEHVRATGTSMAAPHVAGTAALLLQAYPGMTAAQVKSTLKGSASAIPYPAGAVQIGAGRLNAIDAFWQGGSPPVAELEPIPMSGSVRMIRGRVEATNLTRWRLEYTPYKGAFFPDGEWKTLATSTTPPAGSLLLPLEVRTLPDGRYLLRLTVQDGLGNLAEDHSYTEIDKIKVTRPLPGDIERAGDPLQVSMDVDPTMTATTYTLEYSSSPNPGPGDWTQATSGPAPSLTWDTTGLVSGSYAMRITIAHDGFSETKQQTVKLDPRLRPGWPIRLPRANPIACGSFSIPCPLRTGWLDPSVADLDGDGSSEILGMHYTPDLEIRAYAADGSLVWQTPLGSVKNPDPNFYWAFSLLNTPVIGDPDGDGSLDIYAYNPLDTSVYALGGDGTIRSVWKLPLSAVQGWPRLVLADLNADGMDELLLSVNLVDPEILVVRTTDGSVASRFEVRQQDPTSSYFYSTDYSYAPAVGDLDDDPDLEIVAADDAQGRVHAFDWTGTRLWSYEGKKADPYTPPVIGDLDGDGDAEVVIGLRGHGKEPPMQVMALRGNGTMLPGWPVERAADEVRGGLALADLDADDDLEILFNTTRDKTWAYHHTAAPVAGWPTAGKLALASPPVVGDTDGDPQPEIVLHHWSTGDGQVTIAEPDGAPSGVAPYAVENSHRAAVMLTSLEAGGPAVVLATSEGDSYKAASTNTTITKGRISLYAWDMPTPYDPAAMPWPMFQHDLRRTGNFDGAFPGADDPAGTHPKVAVSLSGPDPACCAPPLQPAVKDNDLLTWSVTSTKEGPGGDPEPCPGCSVEEILLRQFALPDCVNPIGQTLVGGSSYHAPFSSSATAIQLAVKVKDENGASGIGLSNCLHVDNTRPTATSAVVSENRKNVTVTFSERVGMDDFVPGDWIVEDDLGPVPATPRLLPSNDLCFSVYGCTALVLVFERELSDPQFGTLRYRPSPISARPYDRVGLELLNLDVPVVCDQYTC